MSDETPVERRLRDLVADFAHDDNTNAQDIDCGREAIRLLREAQIMRAFSCDCGVSDEWFAKNDALIARCEASR